MASPPHPSSRSRPRSSARQNDELEERRTALVRLLLIGVVAWSAFVVFDVIELSVRGGTFRVVAPLLVARFAGLGAGFVVLVRLRSPKPMGSGALTAIDFVLFAVLGALIAMRGVFLGGMSSRLFPSMMILAFARAALLPSHWTRAFLVSSAAAIMAPIAMAIGVAFSADVRARWSVPGTPTEFLRDCLHVLAAIAIGAAGSHFGWSARRQVREARKLGRYRLKARIATGGNGEVWLARQDTLVRDVALKVLRDRALADREALRRFEREARAVSQLKHPNTINVYDYGVSDDGVAYIAMELLEGMDLDSLVAQKGPLPAARVAHFARQACASLGEAHALGIVHRDIKPANLFVTRSGETLDFIKLLDFGVAKLGDPTTTVTEEGLLVGTPAFMAPEICAGERGDARSDVYSLGAAMYYLLTGVLLFPELSLSETVMAHMARAPAPPSTVRSVPAALERIVLRCLEKAPADRYATADDLARELAAFAAEHPWTADDAMAAWAGNHPTALSSGERGAVVPAVT